MHRRIVETTLLAEFRLSVVDKRPGNLTASGIRLQADARGWPHDWCRLRSRRKLATLLS